MSRYSDQSVTAFNITDSFKYQWAVPLQQDRDGQLLIGSYSGAVLRYDGQTWTAYESANGRVLSGSILADRQGGYWFGARGGVVRYDGETWTTFTPEDGLVEGHVFSMLEDRAGQLWFAFRYGGVSRYDGETWTTFTSEDGLGSDLSIGILEDQDGHIWVSSEGGGVSRYISTWPRICAN